MAPAYEKIMRREGEIGCKVAASRGPGRGADQSAAQSARRMEGMTRLRLKWPTTA